MWIFICEYGLLFLLKCMNVCIVCVYFFLFCRNLNGNNFVCDCNVYNFIVVVIIVLIVSRVVICVILFCVVGVEFYFGGFYEK